MLLYLLVFPKCMVGTCSPGMAIDAVGWVILRSRIAMTLHNLLAKVFVANATPHVHLIW